MVDHWVICIDLNEKKHTSKWRTHLKGTQQKKLSKIRIVVTSIVKSIKAGEKKSDVISEMETLYSTNKSSVEKLTDAVKKKRIDF